MTLLLVRIQSEAKVTVAQLVEHEKISVSTCSQFLIKEIMSALNMRNSFNKVANHVGTFVDNVRPENKLKRVTLASMLWNDNFYVDGIKHADYVKALVPMVKPEFVAELAKEARSKFKLRHIPLLLTRELARSGKLKNQDLTDVIQRPDEMGEFLAMYWKEGRTPISNQVKLGIANAFSKFNEYQLAKWDKNSAAIRIRDVMFLTHPKPRTLGEEELFKRIANDEMKTPDTWETSLSAGADKGETFTRLMMDKKLGALAFIRNLRNMVEAGVDESLIRSYAKEVNLERILPFRFIAAARVVPQFEDMLEDMMFRCVKDHPKLPGKTVLVIDVSGSMFGCPISEKSDLDRFDAAAALAVLCREVCESVEVYSFSDNAVLVPPRRGFALVEAIRGSQRHNGTQLGTSLKTIHDRCKVYDRIVVLTDEQSYDRPSSPKNTGYIINVATYENGIGSGTWNTINGFSEAIVDYLIEAEKS